MVIYTSEEYTYVLETSLDFDLTTQAFVDRYQRALEDKLTCLAASDSLPTDLSASDGNDETEGQESQQQRRYHIKLQR